jgi:Outer membrane protein beta-barrel domain
MRRLLIACATVLCASTGIAQQPLPNNYILSLGVGGGATIPTGNGGNSVKTGFNGQAYALVQLPGFLALRFNFGYQKFDYNLNNTLGAAPGTREILSGVGGLQINLLHGPVRPYLTAGVGAFDLKGPTDSSTTATASSTMSRINFGIDAGAGLAVVVGRVSAFAEGRVQNVYTKDGGFIKSAKQINVVPVTFGLAVGLF